LPREAGKTFAHKIGAQEFAIVDRQCGSPLAAASNVISPKKGSHKMTSYLTRLLTAGAIGAMVMTQPLLAQGTDSKKFFEELSTRGVKTESLDADKFFAELAARGVSSSNRMDADKFFEELAARGVSTPPDFDRKKFFDELAARGVKAPDVINAK
jgi:hypothetical protein